MAIKVLQLSDMRFVNYRPKIEVPDLRKPEYEYLFHDPTLKGMADIAKAHRIEMAYVQMTEQFILAGMFGNAMGGVRTTINANTSSSSITTGALASSGTSGNMDQTPTSTAVIFTGHPQAAPNFNEFSVIQEFLLTAAAATSLTFSTITTGYAITHTGTLNLTDVIFVAGSAAAGGATGLAPIVSLAMYQNLYIGLSTQAFAGSTQANLLSGEPTAATGGYARIGYPAGGSTPSTLWNTQLNFPLPSAASPSVLTTANGAWSFAASTASWSTGATNLSTMFIADAYSAGSGNSNILVAGALTTPQAVAAANITLSFANQAITMTLT